MSTARPNLNSRRALKSRTAQRWVIIGAAPEPPNRLIGTLVGLEEFTQPSHRRDQRPLRAPGIGTI